MKGGHNRLPDAVKAQRGTKRKCRTLPAAPEVVVGAVPPPPRGMTPSQRAVWKELAEQVDDLGVYSKSNATAFRMMVEVVTLARYPDPRDPATAKVQNIKSAAALLQAFGLTPASRSKVSVVRAPKQDRAEAQLFTLKAVSGGK